MMEPESTASKPAKFVGFAAAGEPAVVVGGAKEKKPMNAFLLFCKRHRASVKDLYPNLENRQITKILGEFWGSLSGEEKLPYSDLATDYKDYCFRENPLATTSRQKSQMPSASSMKQPLAALQGEEDKVAQDVSQGSSGSSSPEPSSSSTSAPKPFKKRYLAAEKAKISGASSEEKSVCESLLKLAEGESPSPDVNAVATTVCNAKAKSNPYDRVPETGTFSLLKQGVWTRVAKTIITQEEEKGRNANANHDDKPINLSSQCLIPNATIIEHIIENLLDVGSDNTSTDTSDRSVNSSGNTSSSECNNVKEQIYQNLNNDVMRRTVGGGKDGGNDLKALWKMLPNPIGVKQDLASTTKNGKHELTTLPKQPLSGKEKAHSAPASQSGSGAPSPKGSSESVSVTLVTETDLPLNLSKTPPQTPASGLSAGIAITITTTSPAKRKLLEDDDDIRPSRACKGRRYQEFKDAVGRRGRRPCGKSDGESSQHSEDEHTATVSASSIKTATTAAMATVASFSMATPSGEGSNLGRNETKSRLTNGSPPFDLEKELQAIPALRPEEFQRRIQANKGLQHPRLSSPAQTDLHLSAVATAKKTKAQKQNPSAATPQAHHQQQLHQRHQPQQVHQQGHAPAAVAAPAAAATKSQWDSSQRH